MKSLMRSYVYRPKMIQDIQNWVKSRSGCTPTEKNYNVYINIIILIILGLGWIFDSAGHLNGEYY